MLDQKKIFADVSLDKVVKKDDYSLEINTIDEYTNDEIHSFKDKYQKNIDPCVSTDTYYLDFGYAQANDLDEPNQKSITVTNHTKGKLLIFWNSNQERPFSIVPESCEIPPLKNYSFRVKFTPVISNYFISF